MVLDYIKDLDTSILITEEMIECVSLGLRGDDFRAGDEVRFVGGKY